MILFYLRHGDPIYEPDSLTPLGHCQAKALAKRLALYGLDEVYSSTSNRAILTSAPTCEILKLTPTLLDFANEAHAWDELTVQSKDGKTRWLFEDAPSRRLLHTPEVRALGSEWYRHPAFAEHHFEIGMNRIQDGVDRFLESLGYAHIAESGTYQAIAPHDRRIALFAHQGFGLAFLSTLLDIPYPQICTHFDMCHSGMTVIEFATEDGLCVPRVLSLSSDAHIYREGLPTNYNNYLRF